MTTELIAALSAIVVALIAAFVPALSSRDGRKKALDEAELLIKLKESLGEDAAPVKDLESVLAHRAAGWKDGVDLSALGWFLRLGMILAALAISSSIAVDAISGQELQSKIVGALEVVQLLSVWLMVLVFLTFFLASVLKGVLEFRRWRKG